MNNNQYLAISFLRPPLMIMLDAGFTSDRTGCHHRTPGSSVLNFVPLIMPWPHAPRRGRVGVRSLIDVLGARCVFTSFQAILNAVPRGGGLNLSDARNGGSGEDGGNRFCCVYERSFHIECTILRSRNSTTTRGETPFA